MKAATRDCTDLCEMLSVARPAVRDRLAYLVEKGLLTSPPSGAERRMGFVGIKFFPYQVDPVTKEIVGEQEYDLGDYTITIKRKGKRGS